MSIGIVEDFVKRAEVVALDVNQERLGTISERFGIDIQFNVLAPNASEDLKRGNYDVVVSAIGPFYAFGESLFGLRWRLELICDAMTTMQPLRCNLGILRGALVRMAELTREIFRKTWPDFDRLWEGKIVEADTPNRWDFQNWGHQEECDKG